MVFMDLKSIDLEVGLDGKGVYLKMVLFPNTTSH